MSNIIRIFVVNNKTAINIMSDWEKLKKRIKEKNKHDIVFYASEKGFKEFDKAIKEIVKNTKV